MKCKFCKTEVKPKMSNTDLHCKIKSWTCPKCGIIKSQKLIDGEVMFTYIKKEHDLK